MKIKNPLVEFVTAHTNTHSIIASYFPEWTPTTTLVRCPFHDDFQDSLNVDPTGKAYCHGCGWKACNIIELICHMDDRPRARVLDDLYAEIVPVIPREKAEAFHAALRGHPRAARQYLANRGISDRMEKEWMIGYDPNDKRITIPVFDRFGYCVNIRRMGWRKEHRGKALNTRGHGEVRLFPENHLYMERRVLLVEGEWDTIVARSFGLPAVTWTGGASSCNAKYEWLFKDKAVWILYDNDRAGRKGADRQYHNLLPITKHVTVVEPPAAEGKDVSDWARSHAVKLTLLANTIKRYKFPRRETLKTVCPTCGGKGYVK